MVWSITPFAIRDDGRLKFGVLLLTFTQARSTYVEEVAYV